MTERGDKLKSPAILGDLGPERKRLGGSLIDEILESRAVADAARREVEGRLGLGSESAGEYQRQSGEDALAPSVLADDHRERCEFQSSRFSKCTIRSEERRVGK